MKITKFVALLGLVMLAGCLAGGALLQLAAPHLLHQTIITASHTVGVYANTSLSPLSARPSFDNPILALIYFLLSFFRRPV